jgi:DNA-binding XRE family transcriptional regulator
MRLTLKQARNLSGLSRQKVGEEIQADCKTIINWEKGKSYPNAKKFLLLCKLYGVSPDDIILP